ncbi:hypothetical protein DKX38_022602 [Salix brachista]|uniref:RINT1-like protein MAG2 n=1 Tax=Salix brachista TaxID=2182728 RepID=A0A5N5K4L0_9ROSI|nr:hypothetical protein DKX38_022602 [Salix brachista]
MDASIQITLPSVSALSSPALSFLNSEQDLSRARSFIDELQSQCFDLDQTLIGLNSRLHSTLLSYASFSDRIHLLFDDATSKLTDLRSFTCPPPLSSSLSPSDGQGRKEEILGEELPVLAKEVARVETVRAYAETALKLDTLVGDIEDVVSSTMNKNLRKHSSTHSVEEMRLPAIERLRQTEDVLISVTVTHPQWTSLVSAVDHRIDRALATLRPQAIADHRSLLGSLGWPPPLSTLMSANLDAGKSTAEVSNPLFTMQGLLKQQYCENFLALCHLQELQWRRKSRQLEGSIRKLALQQPLWAIEELVNPISIACQRHFSKWIDKPEFIFALVYKITRDYVNTMDELLQPLVDEVRLVGYSCREEWISAMVTSLVTYLAKEIFPNYVAELDGESVSGDQSKARVSWLHLVDLMIAFDKQIQSLVTHSGISLSLQDDGSLQKISSLSVFCDRPDWFDIWAEIECNDTLEKLKPEVDDERNWTTKIEGALLSGFESYKSPAVSTAFVQRLLLVIDRCRSLPNTLMRSRFLKMAGGSITQRYLDCLLLRCQEAEGLTALTDDNGLIKVANCVNAARYFESVLKEWCEDTFFLELGFDHSEQLGLGVKDSSGLEGRIDEPVGCIFDEEIKKLENFRKEWVEKISVVALRGFDARSREYFKNRRHWQEKCEESWTMSKNLVGALDYLQGKMAVAEENLNQIDFVGVWRSFAAGVDQLLFNGLMSIVKFHDAGVERLNCDMDTLFGVFGAWCLRPEAFFPKTSDGLKLLKMNEKQLRDTVSGGGKRMKENGVIHLNVAEAEKIQNKRVFMS